MQHKVDNLKLPLDPLAAVEAWVAAPITFILLQQLRPAFANVYYSPQAQRGELVHSAVVLYALSSLRMQTVAKLVQVLSALIFLMLHQFPEAQALVDGCALFFTFAEF